MKALTFALEEPFHQKGDHSKKQQPSVFRQKGDGLPHGFENEAHDRVDEARQEGCCFFANLLQPFSYAFAQCFQGVCYHTNNGANDSPGGNNNSSNSDLIFLIFFLLF